MAGDSQKILLLIFMFASCIRNYRITQWNIVMTVVAVPQQLQTSSNR